MAIDCFLEGLMPGVSLITVSLRRSMMLSIEAFHAKEFSESPLEPIYTAPNTMQGWNGVERKTVQLCNAGV